jgi:hypothetical protein
VSGVGTPIWNCGFGSLSTAEFKYGDKALVSASGSLVTPPSVPTGFVFGPQALKWAESASGGLITTGSNGLFVDFSSNFELDYFVWLDTDPTLGIPPFLGFHDGAGNGCVPAWDSADSRFVLKGFGTGAIQASSDIIGAAADAVWYHWKLRLRTVPGHVFCDWAIYKWNATASRFDLLQIITADTTIGTSIYFGLGDITGNKTGAATLAAISTYKNLPEGTWGPEPVAPYEIYISRPISKSTNNTNIQRQSPTGDCVYVGDRVTGTADSGGTAPTATTMQDSTANWTVNAYAQCRIKCGTSTAVVASNTGGLGTSIATLTAAGWVGGTPAGGSSYLIEDSETAFIIDDGSTDYPQSDATTGYLRTSNLVSALQQQRHKMTQSLITSGRNVVSQTVRALVQEVDAGGNRPKMQAYFRLGTGTEVTRIANEEEGSSGFLSGKDIWTWGEVFHASRVEPGTSTGFATGSTDSDQAQCGYGSTAAAAGNRMRVSAMLETWLVVGTTDIVEGAAIGASPALGSDNMGVY